MLRDLRILGLNVVTIVNREGAATEAFPEQRRIAEISEDLLREIQPSLYGVLSRDEEIDHPQGVRQSYLVVGTWASAPICP